MDRAGSKVCSSLGRSGDQAGDLGVGYQAIGCDLDSRRAVLRTRCRSYGAEADETEYFLLGERARLATVVLDRKRK